MIGIFDISSVRDKFSVKVHDDFDNVIMLSSLLGYDVIVNDISLSFAKDNNDFYLRYILTYNMQERKRMVASIILSNKIFGSKHTVKMARSIKSQKELLKELQKLL